MKRYPAYKDSGIEWIGEVPDSWELKRLKYAVSLVIDKSENIDGVFKVALENIESGTGRLLDDNGGSFEGDGNMFRKGDVLFNKLRPYLRKAFIAPKGGMGVGELLVLRPKDNNHNRFLLYRVLSDDFISVVDGSTYGSKMPRASWEFIGDIRSPLPSPSEQQAIADFLDKKTARIDDLIAKKQRQIELLKEQRQAVINQAVTKGLNLDAKMKDSGIDWLGKVPVHWNLSKLKWIVSKIGSGVTPKGGSETYQDSGIPLIRSQNVHFDGLRLDDIAFISQEVHQSMIRSAVQIGDVLLNITGASIGRCTYAPEDIGEANVNQHVCILRPIESLITTQYLCMCLSSQLGQDQVQNSQEGTSREGLNYEQLGNFVVGIPSIKEQINIVEHVDTQTSHVRHSVSVCEKQIELLHEYRTALISEAVMGKIDVR